MANGTDWRLKEKLKIEMAPSDIREAMAIIAMIDKLFKANPRVRGKERMMTSLICLKSIRQIKYGKNRCWMMTGIWSKKCIRAPATTPKARPLMPQIG